MAEGGTQAPYEKKQHVIGSAKFDEYYMVSK
jgi:hypothetical protein